MNSTSRHIVCKGECVKIFSCQCIVKSIIGIYLGQTSLMEVEAKVLCTLLLVLCAPEVIQINSSLNNVINTV